MKKKPKRLLWVLSRWTGKYEDHFSQAVFVSKNKLRLEKLAEQWNKDPQSAPYYNEDESDEWQWCVDQEKVSLI